MKAICLAVLATPAQEAKLDDALKHSDALHKFVTDSQTQVLVVDRTVHRGKLSVFSLIIPVSSGLTVVISVRVTFQLSEKKLFSTNADICFMLLIS